MKACRECVKDPGVLPIESSPFGRKLARMPWFSLECMLKNDKFQRQGEYQMKANIARS